MTKDMLHTTITGDTLEELEQLAEELRMPKSVLVEQFIKVGIHIANKHGIVFTSVGKAYEFFEKNSKEDNILDNLFTIDTIEHARAIAGADSQRQLRGDKKVGDDLAKSTRGKESIQHEPPRRPYW